MRYLLTALVLVVAPLLVAAEADTPLSTAEHGNRLVLEHPDAPWALVVDLPGFEIGTAHVQHGKPVVKARAANAETGVVLLARIGPGAGAAGAAGCREAFARDKRPEEQRRDVGRYERDGSAVIEYTVRQSGGVRIATRHLHAWRHRDGLCAGIRVTLAPWDEERDRPHLDDLLATLRIVDQP